MPHLRLEVPEEWLRDDFIEATGFDARKLLDHLVEVVAGLLMERAGVPEHPHEGLTEGGESNATESLPMINKGNLKHALIPVYHSGVGGDRSKRFLHLTFAAGNDQAGRTASVRRQAAETLGDAIDSFVGDLPALESATVHVVDIDRDRGYSTTAERKKKPRAG
jgi:hypothetical protein